MGKNRRARWIAGGLAFVASFYVIATFAAANSFDKGLEARLAKISEQYGFEVSHGRSGIQSPGTDYTGYTSFGLSVDEVNAVFQSLTAECGGCATSIKRGSGGDVYMILDVRKVSPSFVSLSIQHEGAGDPVTIIHVSRVRDPSLLDVIEDWLPW